MKVKALVCANQRIDQMLLAGTLSAIDLGQYVVASALANAVAPPIKPRGAVKPGKRKSE